MCRCARWLLQALLQPSHLATGSEPQFGRPSTAGTNVLERLLAKRPLVAVRACYHPGVFDSDPIMLPRRRVTKVVFVVVSLGLVMGLCTVACWIFNDAVGGAIDETICMSDDTSAQCR